MRMLHNNLLVKKLTKEQLGHIVMPDSVKEEWHRGKVIAVGPKVEGISVDDVVVYLAPPPHVGEFPKVDSKGNVVITDTYICAIED